MKLSKTSRLILASAAILLLTCCATCSSPAPFWERLGSILLYLGVIYALYFAVQRVIEKMNWVIMPPPRWLPLQAELADCLPTAFWYLTNCDLKIKRSEGDKERGITAGVFLKAASQVGHNPVLVCLSEAKQLFDDNATVVSEEELYDRIVKSPVILLVDRRIGGECRPHTVACVEPVKVDPFEGLLQTNCPVAEFEFKNNEKIIAAFVFDGLKMEDALKNIEDKSGPDQSKLPKSKLDES